MTLKARSAVLALAALAIAGGVLYAQAPTLTRTEVGRGDVSVPGREAVVTRVEIPAGVKGGRHTHPGDEITYVTEGVIQLVVDGQPPRTYKAGEAFVIPAGVVHDPQNNSASVARTLSTFVVEKGKPLATPAK